MLERESKILGINPEQVIQNLEELGAQKTFDGIIEGMYYICGDKKIRVRKEKRGTVACVKYPVGLDSSGCKVREEVEVVIDDTVAFEKILTYFGFAEYKKIHKTRVSFSYRGASIEIDEYGLPIPPLLEIEAGDYSTILSIAQELGFKEEDLVGWSFTDIEAMYGK